MVNFPWNSSNIDQWVYRPVKIKGRQIHKHTMFPERYRETCPGADYIVPLVTKEDDVWSVDSREGILLNKGYIPRRLIRKKP